MYVSHLDVNALARIRPRTVTGRLLDQLSPMSQNESLLRICGGRLDSVDQLRKYHLENRSESICQRLRDLDGLPSCHSPWLGIFLVVYGPCPDKTVPIGYIPLGIPEVGLLLHEPLEARHCTQRLQGNDAPGMDAVGTWSIESLCEAMLEALA